MPASTLAFVHAQPVEANARVVQGEIWLTGRVDRIADWQSAITFTCKPTGPMRRDTGRMGQSIGWLPRAG